MKLDGYEMKQNETGGVFTITPALVWTSGDVCTAGAPPKGRTPFRLPGRVSPAGALDVRGVGASRAVVASQLREAAAAGVIAVGVPLVEATVVESRVDRGLPEPGPASGKPAAKRSPDQSWGRGRESAASGRLQRGMSVDGPPSAALGVRRRRRLRALAGGAVRAAGSAAATTARARGRDRARGWRSAAVAPRRRSHRWRSLRFLRDAVLV